MKHFKTLGLALALAPTMAFAQAVTDRPSSVLSDLASPEMVAQFKKKAEKELICPEISTEDKKIAAFVELQTHRWSRKDVGCAAQYGYGLAMAHPDNPELVLGALGAYVTAFDVLSSDYNGLYEGPQTGAELSLRWEQTRGNGLKLIEAMKEGYKDVLEFKILHGAFLLSAYGQESSIEQRVEAVSRAIALLEETLKQDPKALGGLTPYLLGRTYLSLPAYAGGDSLRALELLKQGAEINPDDISMLRWLAEAHIGERENTQALAVIRQGIGIAAEKTNSQVYADELRAMGAFAKRLGDSELANKVYTMREQFLDANPKVNRRQSSASMGHGGVDPFTGKQVK